MCDSVLAVILCNQTSRIYKWKEYSDELMVCLNLLKPGHILEIYCIKMCFFIARVWIQHLKLVMIRISFIGNTRRLIVILECIFINVYRSSDGLVKTFNQVYFHVNTTLSYSNSKFCWFNLGYLNFKLLCFPTLAGILLLPILKSVRYSQALQWS